MKLLTRNSKIKKMSGPITYNFGIPAYKSLTGKLTCPMAKDCIKGCYARQGAYIWSNVSKVFEERYRFTLRPDFAQQMSEYINSIRNLERIRIHDSGDFYSKKYLMKWLAIMHWNPHIKFYAYTKMVKLFKQYADIMPPNFIYIFSYGGKQDHLINPETDRHSMVFSSLDELQNAGYIDASQDDNNATLDNNKIGLIYHGFKSRKWNTKKQLTNKIKLVG